MEAKSAFLHVPKLTLELEADRHYSMPYDMDEISVFLEHSLETDLHVNAPIQLLFYQSPRVMQRNRSQQQASRATQTHSQHLPFPCRRL